MPELLKNKINYESLSELASRLKAVYPAFQDEDFVGDILDQEWQRLELKARIRKMAVILGQYLPSDYARALQVIEGVLEGESEGFSNLGLLCFPDYVEITGQAEDCWELSMTALERITPYATAEFAVRPFIIKHPKRMMQQMSRWAKHDNEHVRRLASEGCRPQLPWGQALICFKEDPRPVLHILKQLKADPSLVVRKSVANNLNDISKTHPELIIDIAQDWYGQNEHTDWIVKYGCRTLLKKGNPELLKLFGFAEAQRIKTSGFRLEQMSAVIGQSVTFSFIVEAKEAARVRLEYAVDYMKLSGRSSRKIFQISELSLAENEIRSYTKSHSLADTSTRKHVPGLHSITLIVNGKERGTLNFEVLA